MNILVTGGAGYLGSVLTEELLSAGHKVTVLDNFSHRESSLAHLCHLRRLNIICGDCRAPSIVKDLVSSADVVFPLAAIVGAPACERNVDAAQSTNISAVRLIADYASPSQLIVFPNTNSGYGIGGEGEVTEESPLTPLSLYGRSKLSAEQRVMQRDNSISLRFATLFGPSPRMRLDLMVNDFVWRAWKDGGIILFEGSARRNFLHVRDAASAFLHAIEHADAMRGNIYNCGDTRANMTKRDLCAKIGEHVKYAFIESPIGYDPDKRDYVVSNAKLEATGWKPRYSLDDGIDQLIKLYVGLRAMTYANV